MNVPQAVQKSPCMVYERRGGTGYLTTFWVLKAAKAFCLAKITKKQTVL